ncbi:hypothetical protein F5Y19DRAFT_226169 [Xylariaceae sp. FL1651]|nr:hypothetical protein F5Y19DRAFT_226169 [Xylariaceae sp. FL1651]
MPRSGGTSSDKGGHQNHNWKQLSAATPPVSNASPGAECSIKNEAQSSVDPETEDDVYIEIDSDCENNINREVDCDSEADVDSCSSYDSEADPDYCGSSDCDRGHGHAHTNDTEGTVKTPERIGSQASHSSTAVSFLSLQQSADLNRMYPLTQALIVYESQISELALKRKAIGGELEAIRKRQRATEAQVTENEQVMRAKREACGISEELWHEYQKFCEALEAEDYGERKSFEYHEEFNDTYINYDPELELFLSVVTRGSYEVDRNWRCDCRAIYSSGGAPIGFEVGYCTLKPIRGKRRTWAEQFPELYRLASLAAREGSTAALDMLIALPEACDPSRKGCLFEFGFEESRICHPILSQQWGFRTTNPFIYRTSSACNKRTRLTAQLGCSS